MYCSVVDTDVKRNGGLLTVCPGWVSITACAENSVTLKAFTPGGLGCVQRSPALLKYAVNLRGKRIRGTYEYHTRPPKFCGDRWDENLHSVVRMTLWKRLYVQAVSQLQSSWMLCSTLCTAVCGLIWHRLTALRTWGTGKILEIGCTYAKTTSGCEHRRLTESSRHIRFGPRWSYIIITDSWFWQQNVWHETKRITFYWTVRAAMFGIKQRRLSNFTCQLVYFKVARWQSYTLLCAQILAASSRGALMWVIYEN